MGDPGGGGVLIEPYCRCPGCGTCDAHQREAARALKGTKPSAADRIRARIEELEKEMREGRHGTTTYVLQGLHEALGMIEKT